MCVCVCMGACVCRRKIWAVASCLSDRENVRNEVQRAWVNVGPRRETKCIKTIKETQERVYKILGLVTTRISPNSVCVWVSIVLVVLFERGSDGCFGGGGSSWLP